MPLVFPEELMPGSHLEPVQHAAAKVHLEFEMVRVSPTYLLVKDMEGQP